MFLLQADVSANQQIQEAIEKINREKADRSLGEQEATTVVTEASTAFTEGDPQSTVFTEQEDATTTQTQFAVAGESVNLLEAPTLVSPVELGNIVQTPHSQPDVVQAQDKKDDEESLASLERAGGYGSKLNSKLSVNANTIPNRRFRPSKLTESASKMVSGQDVLDINKAISEGIANASASPEVASSNQETKIIGLSVQQTNSVEYNTEGPQGQFSLSQQPIVVADFEQDSSVQTQSESADDVLVTPRPVSSNFLAPITAGVQLQQTDSGKQNYQIEVQKSQPFYLGKFEYMQYPSGYSDEKMIGMEEPRNMTAQRIAMENIQLGAALLNFPVPEIAVKPAQVYKQERYAYEKPDFLQLLPQESIKQQFSHDIETNDITVQQLPATVSTIQFKALQAPLPLPSPYPIKYIEKPIEITRYVNTPVPVHLPYPVEKRFPVPVEKPVTKVIEKEVKVPYTVTKYIERPYPIHVPYPVKQSYPLPIEKPQPYPVSIAQPFYIHLPVGPYPRFAPQPTESIPQLVTIPQARPLYQPQDQKQSDTQPIPTHYNPMPTRTYLPPPSTEPDCDQNGSSSTRSIYYAGLLPPRFPAFRNLRSQQQPQGKYRGVRSDFGKNLRWEYGFLPPMVPSLEIDEYGNPIDKKE